MLCYATGVLNKQQKEHFRVMMIMMMMMMRIKFMQVKIRILLCLFMRFDPRGVVVQRSWMVWGSGVIEITTFGGEVVDESRETVGS